VQGIKELDDYAWSGHSAIIGRIKRDWQSTGWPDERKNDEVNGTNWMHNDMREVSYLYVYKLFDKYVGTGERNE
jgi:hypothetical protein